MHGRDISTKHLIKGMLLMRDISLTKLAEELNRRFGYSFTQSNLSRKLNTDTVKWSELRDITTILGYNIRISPSENWDGIDANNSSSKKRENMTTIL